MMHAAGTGMTTATGHLRGESGAAAASAVTSGGATSRVCFAQQLHAHLCRLHLASWHTLTVAGCVLTMQQG